MAAAIEAWGAVRPPTKPSPSPSCFASLSSGLAADSPPPTHAPWRDRLGHLCEHHYTHATILLLIFLDVGAVLCEVMLRNVCPAPPSGTPDAARLHHWGEGLSWSSRSILFVLLAHQLLLMLAFGCQFFKKAAYVLDLVIVCVALGLEMAHLALELAEAAAHGAGGHGNDDGHGHSHDAPAATEGLMGDGGTLIIVLLCWRVVRIVHGFAVTGAAHTADEDAKEIKKLRARVEGLEGELGKLVAGGGAQPAQLTALLRGGGGGNVP